MNGNAIAEEEMLENEMLWGSMEGVNAAAEAQHVGESDREGQCAHWARQPCACACTDATQRQYGGTTDAMPGDECDECEHACSTGKQGRER